MLGYDRCLGCFDQRQSILDISSLRNRKEERVESKTSARARWDFSFKFAASRSAAVVVTIGEFQQQQQWKLVAAVPGGGG